MYQIDDQLKEFIESGVATIIGTGDAERRPHVVYGWGPRVRDATSIDVFVDKLRADQMLSNVSETGRIAVTLAAPVAYRSVQLKGTVVETGEPDEADKRWVQENREAFLTQTSLIGDPPEAIRNMWLDEQVRVTVRVEAAFDQTPGPEAGKPL